MEAFLRTSDIARELGLHPNTIRLYEEWGFLPPIPRANNNYRLFREEHLDQMRLAHLLLQWPYPGGKKPVASLVRQAAQGDLGGALEQVYVYLGRVKAEIVQAEIAAELLERWARGKTTDSRTSALRIGEVVELLGVTQDALRNWERNALLKVPRDPENGYRLYGPAEISRLRVIRMLRQAGYSMMAILRMLIHVDEGRTENLAQVLDSPRPDEDIYTAADRWLSALSDIETRVRQAIELLEEMLEKRQSLQ